MAYAVSADTYTERAAEALAINKLFIIPLTTGRFLLCSTLYKLGPNDFPGKNENPLAISGWDLVALMIRQ